MNKLARRVVLAVGLVALLAGLRIAAGHLLAPWVLGRADARFERELGPLARYLEEEGQIADAENAAVALRAAVAALDPATGRRLRKCGGEGPWREIADDAARADAREVLGLHAAALAALDRAVAAPRSSFGARSAVLEHGGSGDEIPGLLTAARLPTTLGRLALVEGDDDALLRALGHLAALAAALRHQRLPLHAQTSQSVEARFHDLLRERIARPAGVELLEAGSALLGRLEATPSGREILATEAAFARTIWLASAGSRAGGAPPTFRQRLVDALYPWPRDYWAAEQLEATVDVALAADRPRAEWPNRLVEPRPERWAAVLDPTRVPGVIRSMLLPTYVGFVEREQRLAAERRLARLALDLALAAARDGVFPAALDEPGTVAVTGEAPRLSALDDGGLELSLPVLAAALRAESAAHGTDHPLAAPLAREAERTTWRLPPPARSTA